MQVKTRFLKSNENHQKYEFFKKNKIHDQAGRFRPYSISAESQFQAASVNSSSLEGVNCVAFCFLLHLSPRGGDTLTTGLAKRRSGVLGREKEAHAYLEGRARDLTLSLNSQRHLHPPYPLASPKCLRNVHRNQEEPIQEPS